MNHCLTHPFGKRPTLFFLLLVGGLLGCEGYVDKVDEIDPTLPTDASAAQLLTATQVNYIGFLEGDLARLTGIWAGYFTGSDRQYIPFNNYVSVASDYDAAWGNIFTGIVKNTRLIRQKAAGAGNAGQAGVAKIMEAHTLGMAAALWGAIPNEQAADVANYPNPAFESQEQVYKQVLQLLTEAIADLQAGKGAVSGDVLYGGDKAKWVAAAQTLKAKFYLHQGQYQPAIASAGLGIGSATGNMMATHGSSYLQNFNLYYSFLSYDRPGYMTAETAYAVQLLNPASPFSRNDAKTDETGRFNYLYQEGLNTASVEPNVLYGPDFGNAPAEDGFFSAEAKFPLVTWEENQLILAEAHARLDHSEQALAALNTVRAYYATGANLNVGYRGTGVRYDPYVLADFEPGGMGRKAGGSLGAALLGEILEERYITFIGQLEGFNDVRRTGNALGILPNVANGRIPRRLLYAQVEINANASVPMPLPGLTTGTEIFK